jgi:hypothetical protein
MYRSVKLLPIKWLESLHVLSVGFASFDPALDAATEGQRLYLFVAFFTNVICEPSRATRASAIGGTCLPISFLDKSRTVYFLH